MVEDVEGVFVIEVSLHKNETTTWPICIKQNNHMAYEKSGKRYSHWPHMHLWPVLYLWHSNQWGSLDYRTSDCPPHHNTRSPAYYRQSWESQISDEKLCFVVVLCYSTERHWTSGSPVVLVIEEHSLLEKFQLGLILCFLCAVSFKTDTLALQILLEGKLEEKQTQITE